MNDFHDIRDPLAGIEGILDIVLSRGTGREFQLGQFQVARYDRKGVIEVVGYAAGKHPETLQLP
jgi:hypothetical protein